MGIWVAHQTTESSHTRTGEGGWSPHGLAFPTWFAYMRLSVLFPGSLGNSEEKYYGIARCGPPKTGSYVMPSGTVKWFNGQKGYGFIQPDDGSKDVFVHITALERAGLRGLNEGQRVSYDLERGQQGKTSAVNLRAE